MIFFMSLGWIKACHNFRNHRLPALTVFPLIVKRQAQMEAEIIMTGEPHRLALQMIKFDVRCVVDLETSRLGSQAKIGVLEIADHIVFGHSSEFVEQDALDHQASPRHGLNRFRTCMAVK